MTAAQPGDLGRVALGPFLARVPEPVALVRGCAVLFGNEAFRRLFGVEEARDVVRVPLDDRWADSHRAEVRSVLEGAARDGTIEGTALASNGDPRPVRMTTTSVDLPDGPALLCWFSDLRAVRDAEDARRRSEAFFSALLTRSPEIVTVVGAEGRYRYVSSAARELLGPSDGEPAPNEAYELVHPDDRARLQDTLRLLVDDPARVEQIRYRMRRRDGSYGTFETLVYNELHNPDVQGIVANARDVTDQVALEEQFRQSQKLESIGRLAGGVAHDFNNVLTIILSSTELIEESMKAGLPPQLEDLHEIASAAQRASDLTQQLLAVARKQVLTPVSVDVNQVVRSGEKMLRRLVGEDITLVMKLDPHAGAMTADPGQLHQILLNLAVNGRDAMPQGGILTLETSRVTVPSGWRDLPVGEWVRLVVRDTGIGMSPEVLAHVFEPFFTTKPLGRGTGLGLATVHGIVAQCGGHIRVDSAPGRGARFDVYFPIAAGDAAAAARRPSVAPGGHETILVVEDDRGVRDVATRALEAAGFTVYAAADGYEALAVYEGIGQLALLVTDVVMPRMDGPRLAKTLRERQPTLRVLFASGYTDERIAVHGVLEPGVDLLSKPYTPSNLLARVRAALDRPALDPMPEVTS